MDRILEKVGKTHRLVAERQTGKPYALAEKSALEGKETDTG
jgi:hypothetical protein